ncbi:unnamed protein product [Cunninghamella blakesleeana]
MNKFILLVIYIVTFIKIVTCYLSEPHAPFIITKPLKNTLIKRGSEVEIAWELTPGVKYPIYGYAAASTTNTIVGLLPVESKKDGRYKYKMNNDIKLSDYSHTLKVGDNIEPGEYRIGIGFYYHEASPVIQII